MEEIADSDLMSPGENNSEAERYQRFQLRISVA
jgi:hypothetical protein